MGSSVLLIVLLLSVSSSQVRKWISDWNLTTEKKHTMLRLLYEALVDCKKRYSEVMDLKLHSQNCFSGFCVCVCFKDLVIYLFERVIINLLGHFLDGCSGHG